MNYYIFRFVYVLVFNFFFEGFGLCSFVAVWFIVFWGRAFFSYMIGFYYRV